ncbi:MAG TPA: FlgD immunoglobulin-like domain containing protein, partial [Candidatus Udaeobacter sp.]|nr:FlgD immunoglobulin-like domain containing protein [Candidatus Udaeobacter sp.]
SGAHDVTVLDGILYEAGGWSGLHLWDVRDPAHPVHLAAADENQGPRPHYHCHSVWPTEDRRHVVVMNELESWWGPGQVVGGGVKIFRWDGKSELELEATWQPEVAESEPLIAAHNVVVRGRFAYLSYYQAGLRVLDLENPAQPVEVALYDTYPDAPTALFQGAWGVDLASAGGAPVVLISDRKRGLFALRPKAVARAELAGSVHRQGSAAPIAGAVIELLNAERTTYTPTDGEFMVWSGEGEHRVRVTAAGYVPAELDLALTAGHDPRPVWIELEPKGFATGVVGPAAARARLALGSAAPNPFRESTQIAYTLPAGTMGARLTVLDVAGRVVRELAVTAGSAEVVWDGRDEGGRAMPAGVYHLRLSAAGEVRTARVVRVR